MLNKLTNSDYNELRRQSAEIDHLSDTINFLESLKPLRERIARLQTRKDNEWKEIKRLLENLSGGDHNE